MKAIRTACLILGIAAWSGCGRGGGPGDSLHALSEPDGPSHAMKGYELYAWPASQGWDFALMIGTNRLKTLEEITAPEQTLHGVEAVKAALGNLPAGEQVFWMGDKQLGQAHAGTGPVAIPPAAIRDEIAAFCRHRGIVLTVGG